MNERPSDAIHEQRPPDAPLPTASSVNQHAKTLQNKSGKLCLAVGIVVAISALLAPLLPYMSSAASSDPIYLTYAVIAASSLASVVFLGVRSLKKQPFPNIAGMLGTMLCLIVLYDVLSVLVVSLWPGRN
jgi:hypothetical protein